MRLLILTLAIGLMTVGIGFGNPPLTINNIFMDTATFADLGQGYISGQLLEQKAGQDPVASFWTTLGISCGIELFWGLAGVHSVFDGSSVIANMAGWCVYQATKLVEDYR